MARSSCGDSFPAPGSSRSMTYFGMIVLLVVLQTVNSVWEYYTTRVWSEGHPLEYNKVHKNSDIGFGGLCGMLQFVRLLAAAAAQSDRPDSGRVGAAGGLRAG